MRLDCGTGSKMASVNFKFLYSKPLTSRFFTLRYKWIGRATTLAVIGFVDVDFVGRISRGGRGIDSQGLGSWCPSLSFEQRQLMLP